MQQRPSLLQFCNSISTLPLPDQWLKWKNQLHIQSQSASPHLHLYLQRFNEYFPFNTQYWTKLAHLELKKGKPECIRIFQLALAKNPKSISLWKEYFSWLRETIRQSDPGFLINDLERGLEIIGKHPQSKSIYDYWFESVGAESKERVFQMRKKMLSTAVATNEEAVNQSIEWINGLSNEDVVSILKEQNILAEGESENREKLNHVFQDLINQSIKKYQFRQQFQRNLSNSQYKAYESNLSNWRSYLKLIKKQHPEDLEDTYERALISNCDNADLWKQYFEYLEFQCGKVHQILQVFRSIPHFFKNFDTKLLCYWIELQQTESTHGARQLIMELEQQRPTLQLFHLHIQLEIRAKDPSNAKAVYQSILNVFSNNLEIVAFTGVEFSEFIVKYFRDVQLAKKVLKNLFEKHAFNQRLFQGYVEFYLKHVELKTGNNELFNQYIEIVKVGIKRAYNCLSETEYRKVFNKVTHLMRNYFPNIFFLKKAEKIIIETELSMKNIDMEEIRKTAMKRFEEIDTLSKRRKMNQAQEEDKLQSLY